MRRKLLSFLFLVFPVFIYAQLGRFKVVVIEESSKKPILGASVSLQDPISKKQIIGRQTNVEGMALIEAVAPGTYDIKISFVGMQDYWKEALVITSAKTNDIGTVALIDAGRKLDEVVVKGRVPELQLGIDKKVFDVSQSIVSVGGTAQDLLANVPTLQVDMDGSVSLRGSTGVRILIDGKESAMAGSDVNKLLQSLPADAVSKVEIITNPSAKYDAEGQSGIINIVLKKNLRTGFNGVANASVGSYDNYNAGITLNYRDRKVNYFGGYNYRNGRNVGEGGVRTVQLFDGQQTANSEITNSNSETFRKGINNSFRLGVDYYANEKTTISLGSNLSVRDNTRGEDILYSYRNRPKYGTSSTRTSRQSEQDFGYDFSFDFKRALRKDGEELTANATYGNDKEDGTNNYHQQYDLEEIPEARRKNATFEKGQNWNFQLDYVLPIGDNHKFEAGYRTILRNSDERQDSEELIGEEFLTDYDVTNHFDMRSGVHALYVNYQRMLTRKIGFQAGLRAEDAFLNTSIRSFDPELIASGKDLEYGRLDYFRFYPSLFLTYDVNSDGDKIQMSYSRRVQRPRGWQVNPFVDMSDETNIRQGNPNLMPEDIHAIEVSFAKFYSGWNLLSSAYYRRVNDVTQPFQYDENDPVAAKYLVDNPNATFMRWENIGSRNNFGIELVSKVNVLPWWDITGNANLFYYSVEPIVGFKVNSPEGLSWNGNITTNVKLAKATSAQVRADYRAPMKSIQGKMKSMSGIDVAIKQDVLKGKGSITFNVRDLMDSRRFGGESYLPSRYTDQYFRWSKRTFTLGLSYRFGVQDLSKSKKRNEEVSSDDGQGGY